MKTKSYNFAILFLSFFVFNDVNAQAPNWDWAKGLGGKGYDYCNSISRDTQGNIYMTGYFEGTADFDPSVGVFNLTSVGNYDIFVCKLDSSGNFIWAKSIGGADQDIGVSIAVDAADHVFISGNFRGTVDFDPGAGIFNLTSAGWTDYFICKLDNSGNLIWAKAAGGMDFEQVAAIVLDSSGNIYLTGLFRDTADFDPGIGVYNLVSIGHNDIFISKIDSAGNFIWAKAMGGLDYDEPYAIAIDTYDNVYTTGTFNGIADFDPGVGAFNLTSAGVEDIFVSKLDNSGNFVWAKAMPGLASERGNSIALDVSGNIYITGLFLGTVDFDPGPGVFDLTSTSHADIFISKLNNSGNFVWAKAMGSKNDDIGNTIILDASANIYSTGNFSDTVDFDPNLGVFNLTSSSSNWDIYISKLDSSGNFIWAKSAGGIYGNMHQSLLLDALGNVIVSGNLGGSNLIFGSDSLTNADTSNITSDIFIAKLGTINTGIETATSNNYISLFPNPSSNQLTITLPANFKKVNIIITDITGKIIYKTTESATQKIEVNVKDLCDGIYFLQIQSADFIETKKFIVAK